MRESPVQLILLPEAVATTAPTSEPRSGSRPRGHEAKIVAAVRALQAAGKLPEWLSMAEVRHRCDGWFRAQGLLAHELPRRSSYQRHLPKALHRARALSASGSN